MDVPRIDERQRILTYIQPGLAGLIDGSISSLAPVFATAFSTRDPMTAFKVGLATAIGAVLLVAGVPPLNVRIALVALTAP